MTMINFDQSEAEKMDPQAGRLLISEPFLPDPNFSRSVVFLTEHQEAGSVGFVLNRPLELKLDDVMEIDTSVPFPLYMGGPVQQETLHILHRHPGLGEESLEVMDGIYWGANFEALKTMLSNNEVDPSDFRFFLGYSGWGEGQLQNEMSYNSWIVTKASQEIIFSKDSETMWQEVMKAMGGKFSILANSPEDPQMN